MATNTMNDTTLPAAEAEKRKTKGMSLAARPRRPEIAAAQVRLIEVLIESPDRSATTDDLGDLTEQRKGGGHWVGTVTQQLAKHGLIEHVGFRKSVRATRNCTPIGVWRAAVTVDELRAYRAALLAALRSQAAGVMADRVSVQGSLFGDCSSQRPPD